MTNIRTILLVAACALTIIGTDSFALAQDNTLVKVEGEFVAARGNMLQMKKDDTLYLVKLPEERSLTYAATALPAWLQRGVFVRFEGRFSADGVSQAPVKTMEVFAPYKGMRPDQKDAMTPGIFPSATNGAEGLFGGKEGVKPGEGKGRTKPAAKIGQYKIVGQVTAIGRSGEIGIRTGPYQTVKVRLTEDTTINVKVNSLQLARPGDKVMVDGYTAGNDTQVVGNTVRLIAKDALGTVPEKPVRKTARQRREEAAAKKAAEAAGAEAAKPAEAEAEAGAETAVEGDAGAAAAEGAAAAKG